MTQSVCAEEANPVGPFRMVRALKERRKDLFWAWIAYQTIKGTATSALIWLPALAYWFGT